jgi:hypothetical protein
MVDINEKNDAQMDTAVLTVGVHCVYGWHW